MEKKYRRTYRAIGVLTTILRQSSLIYFSFFLFRLHWMVCQATQRTGASSLGTVFWEGLQHFMPAENIRHDRNQLDSPEQPFKSRASSVSVSKAWLHQSSANLPLLGSWLWDFTEWKMKLRNQKKFPKILGNKPAWQCYIFPSMQKRSLQVIFSF